MRWTGLDWTGLDWTGLDWCEKCWSAVFLSCGRTPNGKPAGGLGEFDDLGCVDEPGAETDEQGEAAAGHFARGEHRIHGERD